MRHGQSEIWTQSNLLNKLFHWLDNNDIPDREVLSSLNACSKANLEQAIKQAKERMGLRCPMQMIPLEGICGAVTNVHFMMKWNHVRCATQSFNMNTIVTTLIVTMTYSVSPGKEPRCPM